ncbi:sulfite exporter TauE/SafE family protein [Jatrophihabitans endophyticus]|uniref:sulfite exporter TauE/SafE family protein n=1 Tax=Jatrophihabitans endophyticus TaxID=1206085 RepID=UPI001A04FE98|nr:sulfite exporter TauE/SafE family protein [Jatrophihabitans endophyticus]MBE7187315.1 sulfite exporter TauE/SafE family protein [Jatrophihabitans endophyticus]
MTWWQGVLVFVAGVWAGTINTVVGSGTLVSFPVLLGIGLSPVTANVSNTLGLFPGSFVGAYGYRRELSGQRQRIVVLGIASLIGAVIGALLLLKLPADAFNAIVPVLIVLALLLVVFGKRVTAWMTSRGRTATEHVGVALFLTVLGTGIYGGYFGAAQGVLLMGFLGLFLDESLQRQNGLKNVLAGLVNLVAAVVFVAVARSHIDWAVAGLVALGSIAGGVLGARIGRRLSPTVLRATIVVVGLAAIAKLIYDQVA